VYWAASAAALALLIVDLFDDGAIWNYGVIVCVIIGTLCGRADCGDRSPRRGRRNPRRAMPRRTKPCRAPRSDWLRGSSCTRTAPAVGPIARRPTSKMATRASARLARRPGGATARPTISAVTSGPSV
jgi:hypothetical protein